MPDTTVGFVGLGKMGLPMAINLARVGFEVVAWNRNRGPLDTAAGEGVIAAVDAAEVGARASTVVTMLPDLPQVRGVLDGEGGVLAPPTKLDTLVVMGTVSPVGVRLLAKELAASGVAVVDAPVSGGTKGAVDGSLSIMVGGDTRAVEKVRPLLAAMANTVRHMGPVGAGSLTKACNQLVVAGTLVSLAEAVLLGERGGLDVEALLDVLGGGLAASEVLAQKRRHLLTGDFEGTGPAGFLVKDLSFALESAGTECVSLPVTAAVAQLYIAVAGQGLGQFDNSIVLEVLRSLSGSTATGDGSA